MEVRKSTTEIPAKDVLIAKLKAFEMNLKHGHVDFLTIESLLINPNFRKVLLQDNGLLGTFAAHYSQALDMFVDALYQIGQYRVTAIPSPELEKLEPVKEKCPQYYLYKENLEGITAYLYQNVLHDYEDHLLNVIAYERWIQILVRLLAVNDFASASSIFTPLSSRADLRKFANKVSVKLLEHCEKIFDLEGKRDFFMGQSIPHIAIYAARIYAINEATKTEIAVPGMTLDQIEEKNNIVTAIQHMQESNAALMNIKLAAARLRNGFSNERIFKSPLEANEKLVACLTQNELNRIQKSCTSNVDGTLNEAAYYDEIRLEIKSQRVAQLSKLSDADLDEINQIEDSLSRIYQTGISETKVYIQSCFSALREYTRKPIKPNSKNKQEAEQRRENIKLALRELGRHSEISKKITTLKRLSHSKNFDDNCKKIFTNLRKALAIQEHEDLDRLEHVLENVRVPPEKRDKNFVLYFSQNPNTGVVDFLFPPLNIDNYKTATKIMAGAQSALFRPNAELAQSKAGKMSWTDVLKLPLQEEKKPRRDSNTSGSDSEIIKASVLADNEAKSSDEDKISDLANIRSLLSSRNSTPTREQSPAVPRLKPTSPSVSQGGTPPTTPLLLSRLSNGSGGLKTSPLPSPGSSDGSPQPSPGGYSPGSKRASASVKIAPQSVSVKATLPDSARSVVNKSISDTTRDSVRHSIQKTRSEDKRSKGMAIARPVYRKAISDGNGSVIRAGNSIPPQAAEAPIVEPVKPAATTTIPVAEIAADEVKLLIPILEAPNIGVVKMELRQSGSGIAGATAREEKKKRRSGSRIENEEYRNKSLDRPPVNNDNINSEDQALNAIALPPSAAIPNRVSPRQELPPEIALARFESLRTTSPSIRFFSYENETVRAISPAPAPTPESSDPSVDELARAADSDSTETQSPRRP